MNKISISILCVFLLIFSACNSKTNTSDFTDILKLGITLKIPENYQLLPEDSLAGVSELEATVLDVEPFSVNPLYIYADKTEGKGIIIISELQLIKDITPESFLIRNINVYKNNLEKYFMSGEISSEDIDNDQVSTILMAMSFMDDEFYLFKGVSFVYPDRFFMIDLYTVKELNTEEDGIRYMDMFNSIKSK